MHELKLKDHTTKRDEKALVARALGKTKKRMLKAYIQMAEAMEMVDDGVEVVDLGNSREVFLRIQRIKG